MGWLDEVSEVNTKAFPLVEYKSLRYVDELPNEIILVSSVECMNHISTEALASFSGEIYCVGQKTAKAVEQLGGEVKELSNAGVESLSSYFGVSDTIYSYGSARSQLKKKEVRELFSCEIKTIDLYELTIPNESKIRFSELSCESNIWIHFSGSAVQHFLDLKKKLKSSISVNEELHFCWGQTAWNTARQAGLTCVFLDHTQNEKEWVKVILKSLEIK